MSTFPKAIDVDDLHVLPDGRVRPSLRMTEEEFVAWCDEDVKAEWVDGEVIVMSPSSLAHVRLAGWLYRLVAEFVLRKDLGEAISPEFMVRLAKQRRRRVPDLLFVSKERSHLLRPNHLEGAPDLSVEIVSPDSQSRDRRDKFAEYEAAGVREYWIVDPLSRTVEAYALHAAGKFRLIEATDDGRLASAVLPGFYLRPDWLWQEPLPDVIATLRELGVQV
jgi:Uma2 family endonuclease